MCLLDYEFLIMDNAFLVHKPGIKTKSIHNTIYKEEVKKTGILIKDFIKPEINAIYGSRSGCVL